MFGGAQIKITVITPATADTATGENRGVEKLVSDGITVGDALREVGFEASGNIAVRRNGSVASLTDKVRQGDRIQASKESLGNA